MADILLAERILHDVIWEPLPGITTSPLIYIMIAAVILITVILIRSMVKRKCK